MSLLLLLCRDEVTLTPCSAAGPAANHGSSVLISGGLGALGSLVGSWACAQGAGHVVLLSRSSHVSSSTHILVGLTQGDACLTVAMCDTGSSEDFCATAHRLLASGHAHLQHFFHAGGIC